MCRVVPSRAAGGHPSVRLALRQHLSAHSPALLFDGCPTTQSQHVYSLHFAYPPSAVQLAIKTRRVLILPSNLQVETIGFWLSFPFSMRPGNRSKQNKKNNKNAYLKLPPERWECYRKQLFICVFVSKLII